MGQGDAECGALPLSCALNCQLAAMGAHDLTGDCQTDAGSFRPSPSGNAVEAFKDPFEFSRIETFTRVGDCEARVIYGNCDGAAWFSRADRIAMRFVTTCEMR